ncbi:MAG: ABC transporter ATP-binding protein [Kofleriaceae bacterium]
MSTSANPVIELRGVSRSFATPHGPFAALSDVDLAIGTGTLVAITGASGSGKSTLLHLIAGIDRPSRGDVRVAGTDVAALGESALARWRGQTVGIVFQFFQLLPTLTVLENVLLPMELCQTAAPREARPRAHALLARVGVADQADKLPAALSGGQQQRAAIARALANDPPVLLADEPTGNLDSRNGAAVLDLLGELATSGKTVVTVTHEPDVARRADRVISLLDGKLAATEVARG